MALAVCLLFDDRSTRAMRELWDRLEDVGVGSLRSHTHGHHVPHLSYAVLRTWDLAKVRSALEVLPDKGPMDLQFDGLGLFRRGRVWLAPAVNAELVSRQQATVAALMSVDADLHKHYLPGAWTPHCTLAPRVRLGDLAVVAAAVYAVLPMPVRMDRAALIDASTGELYPLSAMP